tara:strand:+ start:743 stop:964 length:222 start_codon:yes stop_codon:yes gene_type:complete
MDNLDKKNFLEVGDTVMGKFGLAKINKIELCQNVGEKYGIVVNKCWVTDIARCVFDMDNGHFEYGEDLDFVPY